MKFLIALITLSAVLAVNGDDEMNATKEKAKYLDKLAAECSEELNFDLEDGKKLLVGNLSINSREAKCFVKCFFTKEGFLRPDGHADTKFIVKSLEGTIPIKRHHLEKVVAKCTRFKSDDVCENAFKLLECFFKVSAAREDEL